LSCDLPATAAVALANAATMAMLAITDIPVLPWVGRVHFAYTSPINSN
jgi:hypothetical protein